MRPATPHAVVTKEHAICHGAHFLAASSLQRTVLATIHNFFRGQVITNTDHPSFQGRMNSLASFFFKTLVYHDSRKLGEWPNDIDLWRLS
jgi:hypothetical protein